ncbi:MAG: RDD family protein [Bacteroidetes bacterium]|nr:MAG: RDD family protein [Bacteroidota bacterium]
MEHQHLPEEESRLDLNELLEGNFIVAPKDKRFVHLLVDTVSIYALMFIGFFFVGIYLGLSNANVGENTLNLIAYMLYFITHFAYYITMESTLGKTLGKIITRTRVLDEMGQKPTSMQIVGRSFARLIPFDALSFLFGYTGWHDSLSRTVVVEDSSLLMGDGNS